MGLRSALGLKKKKKISKAPDEFQIQPSGAPGPYWNERKDFKYLQEVRTLVGKHGKGAESVIDIGSNACPYLEWFEWIPDRTSLDLHRPFEGPRIHSIRTDFLAWNPERHYDLALCLQVLEHIPDARKFAKRLLAIADTVIVSVPYMWPDGACTEHVHDPVDEAKIKAWFGRTPNSSVIVQEAIKHRCSRRLICVFEGRKLQRRLCKWINRAITPRIAITKSACLSSDANVRNAAPDLYLHADYRMYR